MDDADAYLEMAYEDRVAQDVGQEDEDGFEEEYWDEDEDDEYDPPSG